MKQIIIFVLLIAAAIFAVSTAKSDVESVLTWRFRPAVEPNAEEQARQTSCSDGCFIQTSRNAQGGTDLGRAMYGERECLAKCRTGETKQ